MKTIKLFLATAALMTGSYITAQNGGIIKGNVVDEKGKPMEFVTVALLEDSSITAATQTDEKGYFTFKQLTPGKYNLKAAVMSYNTNLMQNVEVNNNQTTYPELKMQLIGKELPPVIVTNSYKAPVINALYSNVTSIKIDQIENMPANKNDIVAIITAVTPGVIPTNDGKDIYMRGSRSGSTSYVIDGNRTAENAAFPGLSVAGVEVLTGGVPAEYGDCTGGIVIITTKDYKWEMFKKEQRAKQAEEEQ